MFIDKGDDRLCDECGEPMEAVRDYGIAGQALLCKFCGFYIEEVDLRATRLSNF